MENILEMKNICKKYNEDIILQGMDLFVKKGEIHALLGENGSGKSTLMNILFGLPVIKKTGGFKGDIYFDGNKVSISKPFDAVSVGIGMVHQEIMLIDDFTVLENIFLNNETTEPTIVSAVFGNELERLNYKNIEAVGDGILKSFGVEIDCQSTVGEMSLSSKQFIETAREISKENIKLVVFDEPTAVLSEEESFKLTDVMVRLKEKGISILFITHKLGEVMRVADTITVIRNGKCAGVFDKYKTTVEEIMITMFGNESDITGRERREVNNKEVIMSIRNLCVKMKGEEVRGLDLDVYRGEILGIAGVTGQGKSGLALGLVGGAKTKGNIYVKGKPLKLNDTMEAYRSGIAFVPEDRKDTGLLMDHTISENICFAAMRAHDKFIKKSLFMKVTDYHEMDDWTEKMIQELDIRCKGPKQKARELSGGNQQKVCLARALTLNPEILIVTEAARGVDLGAKKIIMDKLCQLNKEQNVTIIMISSDLGDLREMCNRIGVICGGRIMSILSPDAPTVDFSMLMSGLSNSIEGGTAL